jgi:hypothetical protein
MLCGCNVFDTSSNKGIISFHGLLTPHSNKVVDLEIFLKLVNLALTHHKKLVKLETTKKTNF